MGVAVAALLCWWVVAGCESTSTVDSVITVAPTNVVLTASSLTATFTASMASTNRTLALPLVWTVSDGSLGAIQSSQGLTAVYVSTGKLGNNAVTVRDQTYAEGMALVTQQ